MNSYTSNGEKYRFGYQGDFAEDDTEETGFNHFEARQYDPRIGRWTTIDPAGQYKSPYMGMGNNPTNQIDPDGEYSKAGAWIRNLWNGGGGIYESGGEWGYNTTFFEGGEAVGFQAHFGNSSSGGSFWNSLSRGLSRFENNDGIGIIGKFNGVGFQERSGTPSAVIDVTELFINFGKQSKAYPKDIITIPQATVKVMSDIMKDAKNAKQGMDYLMKNQTIADWVNSVDKQMQEVHHGLKATDYPYFSGLPDGATGMNVSSHKDNPDSLVNMRAWFKKDSLHSEGVYRIK